MSHARAPGQIGIGILGAALIAGALAGCGDSGGLGSGIAPFVGTWHYDESAGVLTCGMDTLNVSPRGNKVFAPGVSADIVDLNRALTDSASFCNFGFDVSGPVATAPTDQTCTLTGGLEVITFQGPEDGWTFTMNGPAKAEEIANMTVTVTDPGTPGDEPTTSTCTIQLVAHLTKVSKD